MVNFHSLMTLYPFGTYAIKRMAKKVFVNTYFIKQIRANHPRPQCRQAKVTLDDKTRLPEDKSSGYKMKGPTRPCFDGDETLSSR